jgi:hypothetical protein
MNTLICHLLHFLIAKYTTDGYDWVQLENSQKVEMVSSVLFSLKSKGYTISEGPEWFIEALDAFYGDDATNSMKITEAMAMSGGGGGVIIKP